MSRLGRLASVGDLAWPAVGVLVALVLSAQLAAAQATGSGVTEQALVDNDTVRVALLVFPPGAASVEHVGLDPELGIVLEGELTLLTVGAREALGPGAVPLKLWVVLVKR
jgi:quercetin dioxygenase-like cupin family protein